MKRLQDQLHKERELRILLEAELEGKLPVSSSKGSCSDAGKNQDGMVSFLSTFQFVAWLAYAGTTIFFMV